MKVVKMKKLFALIIISALSACGSDAKIDTMQDIDNVNGYSTLVVGVGTGYVPPVELSSDAGTDGAIDIAVCLEDYNTVCMPECFKLASGTRRDCFDRCLSLYRMCAGCYGDVSNNQ